MEDKTPPNSNDSFLTRLVALVNRNPENAIPVMLNTGGVTVVGTLRSGRVYFDELAEAFKKELWAQKDEYAQVGGGELKRLGDIYDKPIADTLLYVHIQNAHIVLPGGLRTDVKWWRGRLETIQGFCILEEIQIKGGQFNVR